jgi:hypothetical protein
MRISRRSAAILSFAVLGAVGAVGVALASTNVSTADFAVSPARVPKTTFQSGKIHVHVTTDTPTPGGFPDFVTDNVQLSFDDDIKFRTGSVPRCTQGPWPTGTPPATTLADCSTKKIGVGTANVRQPSTTNLPACVLAFNGKKSGTHPTILLHTAIYSPLAGHVCSDTGNNTGLATSITLVGELVSASGADFGKKLNVDVPPTGNQITDFETTIKKGKYIQARCHDGNHKWNMKAKFTYHDNDTDTVRPSQRCRVRH